MVIIDLFLHKTRTEYLLAFQKLWQTSSHFISTDYNQQMPLETHETELVWKSRNLYYYEILASSYSHPKLSHHLTPLSPQTTSPSAVARRTASSCTPTRARSTTSSARAAASIWRRAQRRCSPRSLRLLCLLLDRREERRGDT